MVLRNEKIIDRYFAFNLHVALLITHSSQIKCQMQSGKCQLLHSIWISVRVSACVQLICTKYRIRTYNNNVNDDHVRCMNAAECALLFDDRTNQLYIIPYNASYTCSPIRDVSDILKHGIQTHLAFGMNEIQYLINVIPFDSLLNSGLSLRGGLLDPPHPIMLIAWASSSQKRWEKF